jgi:hypothetical protein
MGVSFKSIRKSMLIAGMAIALPTLALADPGNDADSAPADSGPTTRPSHFGAGGGGFMGDGRTRQGQGQGTGFRQSNPEEAAAAIDFFNKNSPNRMQYFNALPADGPMRRRERETARLVQLYRPLQNFKDTNSDLYNLLVKQVQLRDDAFELAKDGKAAELRAKAKEIVGVSIEARTKRLTLLQQELDAQKAKLEEDKADTDAAAEKEAASITSQEEQLVHRPGHRQNPFHGASMLDFNAAMDPLAEIAPIMIAPAPADTCPDESDPTIQTGS